MAQSSAHLGEVLAGALGDAHHAVPLGIQDLLDMRQQLGQREGHLRYEAHVHHACASAAGSSSQCCVQLDTVRVTLGVTPKPER